MYSENINAWGKCSYFITDWLFTSFLPFLWDCIWPQKHSLSTLALAEANRGLLTLSCRARWGQGFTTITAVSRAGKNALWENIETNSSLPEQLLAKGKHACFPIGWQWYPLPPACGPPLWLQGVLPGQTDKSTAQQESWITQTEICEKPPPISIARDSCSFINTLSIPLSLRHLEISSRLPVWLETCCSASMKKGPFKLAAAFNP